MASRLVLVTPPAVEPVTLDAAKLHCRVDNDVTADDTLISALITAARQWVEEATGRALITQTWRLALRAFPAEREVRLPRGPVQSVTSLTYLDRATSLRVTVAPATYLLSSDNWGAELMPAPGATWPTASLADHPEAVAVTYATGYGAGAASVPQPLVAAMQLLIAHLYANREAVVVGPESGIGSVPFTVEALTAPYRDMEAV